MATTNFQARLERIQNAQADIPQPRQMSIRSPGIAGIAASNRVKRRRHPIKDHVVATALGVVLGCLVAVALVGLSFEGSPWGVGTPWYDLAFYAAMGGLALAPILMLLSLMLASKKPGFALFSLGYLSGVVVPLFI